MKNERSQLSLAETDPELALEWHPTLNSPLTPSDVTSGNSKKIWWLGSCGHEWEAVCASRSKLKTGCPFCSNQKVLIGLNDLASKFPLVASEWHPTKNLGIEPTEVSKGSNKKYWWQCKKGHEWATTVSSRTTRNTKCPYCQGTRVIRGENDFATQNPDLSLEWHPTKNDELSPADVSSASEKKVWWRGKCGHEWDATVASRSKQGTGCPICNGKKILEGFNDLASTHPDLASEWHPTKNQELLPSKVSHGTRRKAWWLCGEGHEWEAIIANRVWGNGCPYCTHQWVIKGENDLETLSPELALQWHPTRNGDLSPGNVFSTSSKKVWWQCEKGHEWDARISNRRSLGLGCPICANQKLLTGFNDLATLKPDLVEEWHPIKNEGLNPSDIFPNSDLKPWWLGRCGHEWQADVGSRTRGNGCPFCSNKKLLVGFNDLATTHPDLAAEWHPSKNGNLTPQSVSAGTNQKIWWMGKCGHEWEAVSSSRSLNGSGCPICSNHKLLAGFNDLATLGEEILPEWHQSRNAGINPAEIVGPSAMKYWWICFEGHEWLASSGARLRGTGCPSCSVKGYNTVTPGTFYFIQNRELKARKVGISNQTSTRLDAWIALGWELLLKVDSTDGLHILNLETVTLRWIRKDLGLPPYLGKEEMGRLGGWSETFSGEGVTNIEVINAIHSFDKELQEFND